MEGLVNVEWHDQDYLHLKRHVVCSGLATPDLKRFGKPEMPFRTISVQHNPTVQLLASLLDADRLWTAHELAPEV